MKTVVAILASVAVGATASAFADNEPTPAQTMWTPAAGDQIHFDVLRQGNKFGTHKLAFSQTADGDLEVDVDVSLRAGLGPITVFRYELEAKEVWRDGKLVMLEAKVNDDGTREAVRASRDDDVLIVDGDGYDGTVDPGIVPASHWNYAQMQANRLLSTENGELIDIAVINGGRETLTIDGQEIEANRYLMDSDIDVTLWYDDAGRWLKLAFEARGQSIEYVLRELY